MIERIEIDDLPTGPAMNVEDLQALLSMVRGGNWRVMDRHLKRIWEAAEKRLMKFNSPQVDGYWKGVKRISEDLMNLPQALVAQISAMEKSRKEE
ncbi:MAG: hypothetical protein WC241_04145 [Candidatus Paceibacterota bacterium]|jgi:hypothetical protein